MEDADVTVRLAGEDDLEALAGLAASFRDHIGQTVPSDAEFRQGFAQVLRDPGSAFLLATANGAALGYLQLRYRYSAWTSAYEGEIEDLFVVPAARRSGVGRRLIERALSHAVAMDCRLIGVSTNERNTAALALYRQMGFVAEPPRWNGGRQLWLHRPVERE